MDSGRQQKGGYELWLLLISHGASPTPPGHTIESPPASKRRNDMDSGRQQKGDYELWLFTAYLAALSHLRH